MISKAASVGILLFDIAPGLIHQQAIEDVGSFIDGGWDGLGGKGSELI